MAYHIYDTEALVLDERPSGEANKIFYLLTPDLGLVVAKAQGIRLLKSKLRFQVAKFSRVRASLVRGKEVWRLIGVERTEEMETLVAETNKRELVAKIFSLLTHYIHGEGEQRALFVDLNSALVFLGGVNSEDSRSLYGWELAVALRTLHFLGYVKGESKLSPIIVFKDWNTAVLSLALSCEGEIIKAVDSAGHASHF